MSERPQLYANQYAVLMADGETGHILNLDETVHLGDVNKLYVVFDDIESARLFIKRKQGLNRTLEFIVYDANHEFVELWKAS